MTDARQALFDIERQIVDYLQGHPCAADSVRGIREWWLGNDTEVDIALVEQALGQLLVQGRVTRVSLPDGSSLYTGPSSDTPADPTRQ
ncbi:hypothetical protein EC912_103134 [Luteibacter rhizovicinus]|uniref:DprA winged helix domain-containing protein n=1 Tax=Luteibacter rhizovicinus TaxID=242606 RepID=A0A4V2W490_9GAMM|nr:hypothetical protein [Luteibacter rhizovicinus]TCV94649.1 hypothetical protein EC912_103134 [Luteibacter rhizovicinus]